MKFKRIQAENFMSIGSMDLDVENRGLLVVTGENRDDPSAESNGSGKSAMIEALYWCLYGKTLRGVRYVDNVVNKKTKKNCHVRVVVQVANGELVVDRYRKHKEHKHAFIAVLDGTDISGTDPRVTQNVVTRELGMDADAFARLVLIGQGFQFRYTDMSDRELKEFIEGLIGANVFAEAHDEAKHRLNAVKAAVAQEESAIVALEDQKAELNITLSAENVDADFKKTSIDTEIARLSELLQTRQTGFDALSREIAETEKQKAANIGQYDSQIDGWNTHIQGLKQNLQTVEDQVNAQRNALMENQRRHMTEAVSTLQSKVSAIDAEIANDNAMRNAAISAHNQKAEEIRARIAKANTDLTESVAPHNERISALDAQLRAWTPRQPDMTVRGRLQAAESDLATLDRRIEEMTLEPGSKCPTCGGVVSAQSMRQHISEMLNPDEARCEIVNRIEAAKTAIAEDEKLVAAHNDERAKLHEERNSVVDAINALTAARDQETAAANEELARLSDSQPEGLDEIDRRIGHLQQKRSYEQGAADAERARVQAVHDQEVEEFESRSATSVSEAKAQVDAAETSLREVYKIRDKYRNDIDAVLADKRRVSGDLATEIVRTEGALKTLRESDPYVTVKSIENQIKQIDSLVAVRREKVKEATDRAYVLEYVVKSFGLAGIRSFMMDSVLQYLNERLKAHCAYLFDVHTQISLSPVRQKKDKNLIDKITLYVSTAGGSYDASSGGERRKVDVALFLAFRDLNRSASTVQPNVEAYDEILSNLDGEAASRVVQLLLRDVSVSTKILITHRGDVAIIGPHTVLKAVKEDGITSYETV